MKRKNDYIGFTQKFRYRLAFKNILCITTPALLIEERRKA